MFEGSMFGEYAQIASFLSSPTAGNYDYGARYLPAHLLPQQPSFNMPWGWGQKDKETITEEGVVGDGQSLLVEDFIMVAEFSEIEGPKPVLTIPKDGGESVDLNSLSVKIMAVDHQTNSESEKIMMFYEELSSQFKRAARYLKYGNRLLFVKDLEKHLQDLDHTKGYLLNQVGRMRLKTTHTQDEEQNKIRSRTGAQTQIPQTLREVMHSEEGVERVSGVLDVDEAFVKRNRGHLCT
ncbi:hypothetical protein C0Q70_11548 [Pomacea canaliculata]|uniref:Uncharacterized protein n=1 Tax=Pomacea canaliculata TaxID=400727 RepID=A0A2T7P693_POMCA|nr:hypothetical protein C0Q70_11548 [Pomacea canaliculata]